MRGGSLAPESDSPRCRTEPRLGWAVASAGAMVVLLLVSSLAAAALGGAAVRPPATPSAHSWTQITTGTSHPPGLMGASMAYDPTDGYVVLFGGFAGTVGNTSRSNVTWTYHAGVWTQLHPPTSPSPRAFGAMTWDAKDGYLLLTGGLGCGVWSSLSCNDTWSFVGGNWTARGVGPAAHYYSTSMAYDVATAKTVLFVGGYGPSSTFAWTSLGWAAFGPKTAPDFGAWGNGNLIYDPALRALVVATAQNLSSCNSQNGPPCLHTWSLSNRAWTALANRTFDTPIAFGMAWDSNNHRAVLYPRSDIYSTTAPLSQQLVGGKWVNVTGFSPAARWGPTITFDAGDGYLLLFGGQSGGPKPALPTTSWEML